MTTWILKSIHFHLGSSACNKPTAWFLDQDVQQHPYSGGSQDRTFSWLKVTIPCACQRKLCRFKQISQINTNQHLKKKKNAFYHVLPQFWNPLSVNFTFYLPSSQFFFCCLAVLCSTQSLLCLVSPCWSLMIFVDLALLSESYIVNNHIWSTIIITEYNQWMAMVNNHLPLSSHDLLAMATMAMAWSGIPDHIFQHGLEQWSVPPIMSTLKAEDT